ncbi:MAG: hypothetical protein A2X17_01180 [Bacteroidetes bacterium GWF2_41_61]|jgi:hypothetical protein|nr:MAG: hypothetical protein A2X20_10050 [Bacteroidetes bacterium GWE2_40_15]OFY27727.1 MAG: hypothetical protein A2X17_01180 [Bacteroidetes bacterium GWF2_41_61]OFY88674.1 MAG: hypothetical protein A2266_00605 [Bacteroidetes bacterium RIFOXYA12_FULL_40_10]PKP05805.1 MAG: hypothetical protein CVU10_10705 [Bacteroidetes bacterium HGW-Bacteroidetes-5]HBG23821.1 hypothetical protein [Rikenellaceae bacterium]
MPKPITLQTKISELLEEYPQLEETLLELSPAFAKLKNPFLRKTIARVTSVKQAAAIAGVEAGNVVILLRKAAGVDGVEGGESTERDKGDLTAEDREKYCGEQPDWYSPQRVKQSFDAVAILNSGDVPMSQILKATQELLQGDIYEFTTPFLPTPILDILLGKGFLVWSETDPSGTTYYNRVTRF